MADIGNSLKIKYGLRSDPSRALQDQWIQRTEAFQKQGYSNEEAGARAAALIFPDVNTCVYASEADTITSLLGRAKNKD